MAYQELAELMQRSNKLTHDEKWQLMAHLTNNIEENRPQTYNARRVQKPYSWHDIRGVVPDPFYGEEIVLEPVAKRDEWCLGGGGVQRFSHKARGSL